MQNTRTRQYLILGALALVIVVVALVYPGDGGRGVRAQRDEPMPGEELSSAPLLDEAPSAEAAPAPPEFPDPLPSAPPTAVEVPPEPSSLVDLRTRPAHWLGRPVRLTLQFQEVVDAWNPFHTRFGPVAWMGFSAWADEQFVWLQDMYEDPAPRLFVRRDGDLVATLRRASTHDRFEATVIVREVFLDEPWVEMLTLAPLEEHVPEGTILHVSRGRAFLAEGHRLLARQQFERACAGPLPAHARAEIERLLEQCGAATGDDED